MSTFLQLTFAGLNTAVIFILVALGMVVTYQVARVENLAQGAFVIYGALVFTTLRDDLGLALPVAILLSLAACSVIAALLFLLMLNRFARRGHSGPVIMSLGAAILLGELARQIWGLNDRSAAPYLPNRPVEILGAAVLPQSLLTWFTTAVLVVAGYLVFERTLVGSALRACADDVEGARIIGVDPRRMQFLSFQIAGLFGGVGGVLLAPLMAMGWASIFPFLVFGAIGAIAGRWEYLPAAGASVAIGLAAGYAGGYGSTAWQDVYLYGAFILALFLLSGGRRRPRLSTILRRRPAATVAADGAASDIR